MVEAYIHNGSRAVVAENEIGVDHLERIIGQRDPHQIKIVEHGHRLPETGRGHPFVELFNIDHDYLLSVSTSQR